MSGTHWLPEAVKAFDAWFERVREDMAAGGADPEEVRADLVNHIETECVAAGVTVVSAEEVAAMLAKMGDPETMIVPSAPPPRKPGYFEPKKLHPRLLWFFGVIWPAVAILAEVVDGPYKHLGWAMPIPTPMHLAILLAAPLLNLLAMVRLRGGRALLPERVLLVVPTLLVGVAAYYSLVFAVITPFALPFFWAVLPMLPLAPLGALYATLRIRYFLWRRLEEEGRSVRPLNLALGIFLGMAPFLLYDAWGLATIAAVDKIYAHRAPESAKEAFTSIRHWGNMPALRSICTKGQPHTLPLGVWVWRSRGRDRYVESGAIPYHQAYYRITGETARREEGFFGEGVNIRGVIWPAAIDIVGPISRNLALQSSRMDGSIAATGTLGYVEWTMELRNDDMSTSAQEARALLELPPGGAVSRVTLWVNGEPREAVVAGREETTRAYEGVVRIRKDPVLVTTCGPDMVQVRCFPVPPRGVMKFRLGITAPLVTEGPERERGLLVLPRLVETNFNTHDSFIHAVWMESRSPLESKTPGLQMEHPQPDVYALRGDVAEETFRAGSPVITGLRDTAVRAVWTPDPFVEGAVVVQRWEQLPATPPARLAVVVDGSRVMGGVVGELAEALRQLPEGMAVRGFLAADRVEPLGDGVKAVADAVEGARFTGGADNVPALLAAWDWASEEPGGGVLWLHGPQPVELGSTEPLLQRWERRPGTVPLRTLAAVYGYNHTLRQLGGRPEVSSLPRLGGMRRDLGGLIGRWGGDTALWMPVRERLDRAPEDTAALGPRVSDHLARLWAMDEYARLRMTPGPEGVKQAGELAARYRLVTPATGAVVLETDAQYLEAGLTPPPDKGIPAIPEPRDILLLAVCAVIVFAAFRATRRRACVSTRA
ncbi:MAG: hypothetical protein H3C30_03285 [Candidatus Hydrogenedentes bacterium]|nr:hypothetical protein [Candidatus Hydrogenedentota bacterium]